MLLALWFFDPSDLPRASAVAPSSEGGGGEGDGGGAAADPTAARIARLEAEYCGGIGCVS